nr:CHAT domain-containing protein [Candidatus Sigynarchaeota archaeon]
MDNPGNEGTAFLYIFREVSIPISSVLDVKKLIAQEGPCSSDEMERFLNGYLGRHPDKNVDELPCKNAVIRQLIIQLKKNVNFSAISYLFIFQYAGEIIAERNEVSLDDYKTIQGIMAQDLKLKDDIEEIGNNMNRFFPEKIAARIESLCTESRYMIYGVKTLKIISNDLTVPWEMMMLDQGKYLSLEINVELSGLFKPEEANISTVEKARMLQEDSGAILDSLRFVIFASKNFFELYSGLEDYIAFIKEIQARYPEQVSLIENYSSENWQRDILVDVDKEFKNRKPLALFFTSHLKFNPDEPLKSEVFYRDRRRNDSSKEIAAVFKKSTAFPAILFLNACDSTRANVIYDTSPENNLFQYFFSGGVKYFIGTQWEIESESAHVFCKAFLDNFINKKLNIQNALRLARLATMNLYNSDQVEAMKAATLARWKAVCSEIEDEIKIFSLKCDVPDGLSTKKSACTSTVAMFEEKVKALPWEQSQQDQDRKKGIEAKIEKLKPLERALGAMDAHSGVWAVYRLISAGASNPIRFDPRFPPILHVLIPPSFRAFEDLFQARRISSLVFEKVQFSINWSENYKHERFEAAGSQEELKVLVMPWYKFIELKQQLPSGADVLYRIIGEIRDNEPAKYSYFYKNVSWSDILDELEHEEDHPVFFYPKEDYFAMVLFRSTYIAQVGKAMPRMHYLLQPSFAAEYDKVDLIDSLINTPDFRGIIARAGTKEHDALAALEAKKVLEQKEMELQGIKLPRYVIVLQARGSLENTDPYIKEILSIMQSIADLAKNRVDIDENITPDSKNLEKFADFLTKGAARMDPLIVGTQPEWILSSREYVFLSFAERLKQALESHIAEKSLMASKQKETMPRSIGQLKDGKFGEIMPQLDKDLGVKAFYSRTAKEKSQGLKNIEGKPDASQKVGDTEPGLEGKKDGKPGKADDPDDKRPAVKDGSGDDEKQGSSQ